MTRPGSGLLVLSREDVGHLLGWDACISLMRDAMIALSAGSTRHLPRAILGLGEGRAFGVMAGGLTPGEGFGAKLISVFPNNHHKGLPSHQGIVLLHSEESGAPVCIADASEITRIRTASASAAATDALARPGPVALAILGYGHQAHAHAHAIARVREITDLRIWWRDPVKATALAHQLADELGIDARPADNVPAAVSGADVICTTTAAATPILHGADVKAGAHVNLVGSSRAGPAEADVDLVAGSRYIADCRANVVVEGTELRNAIGAGLVGEDHIAAEIGEVFNGDQPGRTSDEDITVYKSLGHVAQDIAAIRYLYERGSKSNSGTFVAL